MKVEPTEFATDEMWNIKDREEARILAKQLEYRVVF